MTTETTKCPNCSEDVAVAEEPEKVSPSLGIALLLLFAIPASMGLMLGQLNGWMFSAADADTTVKRVLIVGTGYGVVGSLLNVMTHYERPAGGISLASKIFTTTGVMFAALVALAVLLAG